MATSLPPSVLGLPQSLGLSLSPCSKCRSPSTGPLNTVTDRGDALFVSREPPSLPPSPRGRAIGLFS